MKKLFEQLQQKTEVDHWIQRQRAIVMRLPKWLYGSVIFGTLGLDSYWTVTHGALWRAMHWLYDDDFFTALATIAFPVAIVAVALYAIARLLPPRPPEVPRARVL